LEVVIAFESAKVQQSGKVDSKNSFTDPETAAGSVLVGLQPNNSGPRTDADRFPRMINAAPLH